MTFNIAVLYGSVREGREGIKAARFLMNKLKERGHVPTLVDPKEHNLPMLDKMHRDFEKPPENMETIHNVLEKADAFLVVTGEYNHNIPPALLNLINHFYDEFSKKPSGICSYSVGPFAGVRAASYLRAVMANVNSVCIPTVFPISQVHEAFDADGVPREEAYNRRVEKFLEELEWYAQALKNARQ